MTAPKRERTDYDRRVVAALPAPTPEAARRLAALFLARVDKAKAS